jgi:signal transduction histidine kinase
MCSRTWCRTVAHVTAAPTAVRRVADALFVRPGPPRRPPLPDVVIAAVFVALTIAEAVTVSDPGQTAKLLGLSSPALATLAFRRQYPLLVATVVTNVNFLVNTENQFTTLLSLVLVAFTAGYETRPPRHYLGLALVVIPFVANLARIEIVPSDLAAAMVFLVGPWAVGVQSRMRTDRAEAAESRAAQLEREQDLQAALVAAAERTRIARELHDIVSHSISVVTIQVQAVRRRLGAENAAEADDLAQVEATARQALNEMRRLFGVLRAEGEQPALAPQPGLTQLDALVGRARTDGTAVRLVVEGEPRPLPPGIDLAAYRIAQEGLTNALRHSGASEVTVSVRHHPDTLQIEVRDNGSGLQRTKNPGHGLVGVRERVALYDGTVDVTSSPEGGVSLTATLPTGRPA